MRIRESWERVSKGNVRSVVPLKLFCSLACWRSIVTRETKPFQLWWVFDFAQCVQASFMKGQHWWHHKWHRTHKSLIKRYFWCDWESVQPKKHKRIWEETSWHKHVGWDSPASAFSSPLRLFAETMMGTESRHAWWLFLAAKQPCLFGNDTRFLNGGLGVAPSEQAVFFALKWFEV